MRKSSHAIGRLGHLALAISLAPMLAVAGGSAATASRGTTAGPDAISHPHLSLSVNAGPPGTAVSVRGTGFGASEQVRISFDSVQLKLTRANSRGGFGPVSVAVPRSALPGTHQFQAKGVRTGRKASSPFTARTNWPEFRFGPGHDGFNPTENLLGRANVSQLVQKWSFPTGGSVQSSPSVVNGVVYVGSSDDYLYALNASTGHQIWRFKMPVPVEGSPAVANGIVYVGDGFDGPSFFALSAATGKKLWSFSTPASVVSSPTVVKGVVYFADRGGHVYALNARTGRKLWRSAFGVGTDTSAAIAGGRLFIACGASNVCALSAATGRRLWSFRASSGLFSSPAILGGTVYVGDIDHVVYALNAVTGHKRWAFTAGGYVDSSPAVACKLVYVGSGDGNVYALHAATGTKAWSFPVEAAIASSPAVANGVVYIGSYGTGFINLFGLDSSNGNKLWATQIGSTTGVFSSPTVSDGVVYVGGEDGNVYAFAPGAVAAARRPAPGSGFVGGPALRAS